MPTQTGSIDFTSAGGLKSYAAGQFATQGTVTDMQTQISQNANDITLRATKTEAYQVAQPNLSPYYSSVPYASTNTYWKSIQLGNGFTFTSMGDGWMRVQCTNSGSSVIRRDWYPIKCSSVRAGQPYTWLAEVRNNASSSVSSNSDFYLVQTNNLQFWGQKAIKTIEGPSGSGMSVNIGTCGSTYTLRKVQNAETADGGHWTNNDEANVVGLACWAFRCAANSTIDYEVRLSVYEGEYTGPYKPYSGTQLYASQAELKVQADRIGMVVSNADASSSLQLTPAAITAVTNNLTIKDSSGSATVISGGKIQANSIGADEINATSINASKSLTVGAMTDAAASTILNSNVQIGGRNLLKANDAVYTPENYNAYDLYLTEPIEDGVPYVLQLWGVDVSHTGKTADTLGVDAYYCGSSVSFGGWRGTSYFTNGHADHLEIRFTAYASGDTVSSGGSVSPSPTSALSHTTVVNTSTKYIRLYNSVPYANGTRSLTVGKWKLEKGNKATDWTHAPEDQTEYVDSSVYQSAQPNLSPFFSISKDDVYNASTNPTGYWKRITTQAQFTTYEMQVEHNGSEGWAHFAGNATSGSPFVRFEPVYKAIKPSTTYTFLAEVEGTFNNSSNVNLAFYSGTDQTDAIDPFSTNLTINVKGGGTFYRTGKTRADLSASAVLNRGYVQVYGTGTFDFYIRLSLYEGEYAGPYKPYSGDQLYATNSALAGTNESLEGAIEDIGELSDQLVGTVTEQNKTITTIQTYLNSLRKDLDAEIQSRQQWLNFNAAEGLVIGAAGSTFKTVTTNTSQQFRSGGTVLAETSGTEFVAPVMRSDQILIGDWMWTRRDNGNLSLKWIG